MLLTPSVLYEGMLLYPVKVNHFDGLVQDCCNSSALAMELLQSCNGVTAVLH